MKLGRRQKLMLKAMQDSKTGMADPIYGTFPRGWSPTDKLSVLRSLWEHGLVEPTDAGYLYNGRIVSVMRLTEKGRTTETA